MGFYRSHMGVRWGYLSGHVLVLASDHLGVIIILAQILLYHKEM